MSNTAVYKVQHYRPKTQETEAGEAQSWGRDSLSSTAMPCLSRKRLEAGEVAQQAHFLQKVQLNSQHPMVAPVPGDPLPSGLRDIVCMECTAKHAHKPPTHKTKKCKKEKKW